MPSEWTSEKPAFQEKRKLIERYVTSYALDQIGPGNIKDPGYKKVFIAARHEGFARGQKEILESLIAIEKERESFKARLQQEKNQDQKKEVKLTLKALDFSEAILRKLADTIAWQLLDNQLWLARRLNTDDAAPTLLYSNVQSCVSFADWFNSQNPMGFALISDLTSFIRLGDILVRDSDEGGTVTLRTIELKEGKINEELLPLAHFAMATKCPHILPNFEKAEGSKKAEQLQRLMRQAERLERTEDLVRTGTGQDARGDLVRLSEDVLEEHSYADRVADLIEQGRESGWAIAVIDKCLFLGVYRGPFRDGVAFKMWLQSFNIQGPLSDLRSTLLAPLSLPLHLIPPLVPHVDSVLDGGVRILACLSLSGFAELAKEYGLTVRWLSRKETTKLNQDPSVAHQLLLHDGRALTLSLDGVESHIGMGILSRIFHNLTAPNSVIEMLGSSLVFAKRHREERTRPASTVGRRANEGVTGSPTSWQPV